jgi:membrane-bound ClpP family serine protease
MSQKPETPTKKFEMALHKENYILLAISFAIVVIGFILMMGGGSEDPEVFNEAIYGFQRTTLAPMVVLFGFMFAIYAIMKKPSVDKKENDK